MKTKDYFDESSMYQKFANANAKGKISTQFMSGDLVKGNPSGKNAHEDSVRMEGYELNVRKTVKTRTDMQQPMAGHSEFWIG